MASKIRYTERGGKIYFAFYDKNGKRIIRSSGVSDLEEAKKIASLVVQEWDTVDSFSERIRKKGPGLEEGFQFFLEVKQKGRGLKENTIIGYRRAMRHLVGFFGRDFPLFNINVARMTDYALSRDGKAAPYTIEAECRMVRIVLRFYAKRGEYDGSTDVVPEEWKGSYSPRKRFLSQDEVEAFLTEAYKRDQDKADYFYAWLLLGVRRNDLSYIRVCDVNLEKNEVLCYSAKTDTYRTNPINDKLACILKRRMEAKKPEDILFPKWNNAHHWKNRIVRDLKMEHFSIHDLKRSTGSLLLNAGVEPIVAASITGNSLPVFLQTYGHLLPHRKHEAIGKLNF